MELIKLEDFIEQYWNNEEYGVNTFAFGEDVVVNKNMLSDNNIFIKFVKSEYLPKIWGEVRDLKYGFCIGLQFRFNEVKILDMGETIRHFKIDLPEEEVL